MIDDPRNRAVMQCQRAKSSHFATELTCSHSRAPKSKAKGAESLASHHSILLFFIQIAQKHEQRQTIQQSDCLCLENPLLAAHEKKLKFIIIKRSSGAYVVFPHLPLFRAHRGFENEIAFHNTLRVDCLGTRSTCSGEPAESRCI
jgi:hypothetical protein